MNISSANNMVHGNSSLDMMIQPPQQHHDHHHQPWNSTGTTVGLPALDRNELSEWVEQITKQLIDDDAVASPAGEDSFVISTADHLLRPRKIPRRNNGSPNEFEPQWLNNNNNNNEEFQRTRSLLLTETNADAINPDNSRALSLMALLFESAVEISVENLGEARRILLEIAETASPHAPSCAERVVAHFAQAMTCRVVSSWLGIYNPAPAHARHRSLMVNYQNTLLHSAFQAYNAVSPFVKFAHFTSNQAILEAFHGQPRVHVVDLDVMQGLQWPALFHILATRAEGPPEHVRLTAVGPSAEILSLTGRHLAGFAKRLGISFEFNPVARKPGADGVDASTFQLRRGETLAVHWLRHCLYDATGSDRRAMGLVGELRPRIFTLVEPDMLSHGGSFLDRFVGSLHYYSAVFDSLGACGADDESRHAVEHCLLYREINNVLAVGGPARSGEEKFPSWRRELLAAAARGGGGFAQVAMSGSAMAQAQLILKMAAAGGGGYSLGQGEGCIRAGWKGTSLYTASAWTYCNAINANNTAPTTTTTNTNTPFDHYIVST